MTDADVGELLRAILLDCNKLDSYDNHGPIMALIRKVVEEAEFAEVTRLKEELESHAWEISPAMAQANIDALNAQLAEARDAWAVAISVPQMQVRVASISHAGWLMLRAALEVKP